MLVVILLLLAVVLTALIVLWAGTAAERAVRLTRIERRSDHWRRVGEAAQDVEVAAVAYQRAMEASLGRHEVRAAVDRYRDACRRLARVLAAGPRPPRSGQALVLLLDQRAPETVAAALPAEVVLSEVTDLQDSLDLEARQADRRDVVWSLRARARLALIELRGRLRAISRA